MRTPNDLPAFYRDLFDERVALMLEGCRGLTEQDAKKAAFKDTLRRVELDEQAAFRSQQKGAANER